MAEDREQDAAVERGLVFAGPDGREVDPGERRRVCRHEVALVEALGGRDEGAVGVVDLPLAGPVGPENARARDRAAPLLDGQVAPRHVAGRAEAVGRVLGHDLAEGVELGHEASGLRPLALTRRERGP